MERERFGRGLSVVLVGLGGVLLVLGISTARPTDIAFGTFSTFAGVALYRLSDQAFDTGPVAFAPADSRILVVNLLQLGLVVLFFALVASVFDVGSVTEASHAVFQAPTYLVFLGGIAGLGLGGGIAFLTFRWKRLQHASRSVPFRMIGFTATLGTFVLLLLSQPAAGLAYAAVYTLSRLLVLLGMATAAVVRSEDRSDSL